MAAASSFGTGRANVASGALRTTNAASYIGVERKQLAKLPIPRADVSSVGSSRPTWVYRVVDLDAFLESRLVKPGY